MMENVQTVKMLCVAAALVVFTACSGSTAPETKQAKQPPPFGPGPATATNKHPLAKYIELAGFRVSESGAGKLKIKFAAINHSLADLGELMVKVKLVTTASKPGDPPITEFEAKIPALGPEEIQDVSATATTSLRIYELPDWQFIRADFDITSPAP